MGFASWSPPTYWEKIFALGRKPFPIGREGKAKQHPLREAIPCLWGKFAKQQQQASSQQAASKQPAGLTSQQQPPAPVAAVAGSQQQAASKYHQNHSKILCILRLEYGCNILYKCNLNYRFKISQIRMQMLALHNQVFNISKKIIQHIGKYQAFRNQNMAATYCNSAN